MNLSRRKALIVLLQEYFYNQRQYPFNVDIKEFEVIDITIFVELRMCAIFQEIFYNVILMWYKKINYAMPE